MSNRFLFGLIVIIAVLLAGCSSNAKVPAWVNNTETDDAYYHAVVSVPKYDSRYKEQAFEQAVKNISMQIQVNVDASVSTKETEAFGLSYSDFSSNIQTSSRTRLKDVELYRNEDNRLGYWAHYRLNKLEYRQQRLQQAELGKKLALDLLEKYDHSLRGKRFVFNKSSFYLIKALDELSDLVDMDLSANLYGKQVNLYSEALQRLATLAANTKLHSKQGQIDAITGSNLDLRSTIKCYYEDDANLDIIGLKLNAAFSRGVGTLTTDLISNPLGEAQLEIQSISSADKNQLISIGIDKSQLLEQSDNPLVKKMISSLNLSTIDLPLNVRNPRIW
ncbi:MAG: LPP20 family lipoprotein, partial [Candidatus Cloacimonadaceae bacterium]